MFRNNEQSHSHSLETLNTLYEYDDFMLSIETMVDLGCGTGLDLQWWATRTTRDDDPDPLNIQCVGVDLAPALPMARQYPNITYQSRDFEGEIFTLKNKKYDILWSHDSFQYAVNPIATLSQWWHIASEGAMLIIVVPQTTNIEYKHQAFYQPAGCYYHHTVISLMHQLAVAGWDTGSGFFNKSPASQWITAIAYRSDHKPMNPKTANWYQLAEMNLLPKTAVDSINRWGFVKQHELVLPWIDKNFITFANH